MLKCDIIIINHLHGNNMINLVKNLIKLPKETEWVEFKENNYQPEMIGESISALANGAALHDKSFAYIVWGINDNTHEIEGTKKDFSRLKKGNQELENWLRSLLSPNANFEFDMIEIDNKKVGVLKIEKAISYPVKFQKKEYIRVGSYKKPLNEYPALQTKLWEKLSNSCFEDQIAKNDLNLNDVISLLDYTKYFDLVGIAQPSNSENIAHYLEQEKIISKQDNGLYSITNLGAILFAKQLEQFSRIGRRAMRVIQYQGKDRLDIVREETINSGYASSFKHLLHLIGAMTPAKEVIEDGIRRKCPAYPPIAIRELIANALIHQDFSISGTGPIIDLFPDRIEITNPGIPLIQIERFIDNPPRSRNEKLASLMRKLRICEELGTGWDKIAIECELFQLPAPKIGIYEEHTRITIFAERRFSDLSEDDKLWSCYLHSCIKSVKNDYLTNKSLRERFGLKPTSSASISRLIKKAIEKGWIKQLNEGTAPRYMKYVPFWAI